MVYIKSEIADDIELLAQFGMQDGVGTGAKAVVKEAAERVEAWLATTRDGLI